MFLRAILEEDVLTHFAGSVVVNGKPDSPPEALAQNTALPLCMTAQLHKPFTPQTTDLRLHLLLLPFRQCVNIADNAFRCLPNHELEFSWHIAEQPFEALRPQRFQELLHVLFTLVHVRNAGLSSRSLGER